MGSIRPTADVQPTPIAMRTITLLLLLLAGLIAAVTTAPIPSPDAHHGGPHLEEDGLTWVSEARMKSNKPMMHQKSGHHNMSRKKANMRKQEGVMMKKSNMNNKNNKNNKMKSNNTKRRKNNNMNKRKQQPAASKRPAAQQEQPAMSFAERLQAMRAQQRKEQDAQRKRERDEYLAILKETGEIEEDEDTIKYGAASTEYNPFKEEKREQQKLLKQQSVQLPPETPNSGLLLQEEDDDDDYNPFDVGYLSTVFDSAKQMFGI